MQIEKKKTLHKKEVDDVLGGDEAWKNVAKTDGAMRDRDFMFLLISLILVGSFL